jgi:RecA-family ATPase
MDPKIINISNHTAVLKSELEADLKINSNNPEVNYTTASNCFNIKPMNDWINDAKNRPIPKMLFSEFWYENEICILFADTNLGKSILALQMSNALSKGISIEGFKMEIFAQKVLYFDFELSDKQVENRYSNQFSEHYVFSPNLLRVEINPEQEIPAGFKDFDAFLCHSLELAAIENDIKIIVIDNLTYLKTDTEKAKDALPLMKFLNSIKKKYNLSILVLAHTPKRDASKPLTKNDLSGSKMLMNFCDSCFAIGESAQKTGLRYIKQIKQRNTELIYDTQNVIVCKIEKKSNFLEFVFIGYENELDHLKPRNNEERLNEILELKKQNIPNTQIAERLGISEGTVRNKIKKSENL